MIDAGDLSPEELEALEADNWRRREALAERVELEALEHPASGPPPAMPPSDETKERRRLAALAEGYHAPAIRRRRLEERLEAAERVCELADQFELRVAEEYQPDVDALYDALDVWRELRERS